jgi:hypothetical protein
METDRLNEGLSSINVDMEDNKGVYWPAFVALGAGTFAIFNFLTRWLLPVSADGSITQRWKWRNVATSLLHSIISGAWAPFVFYQAPEMQDDLISTFTPSCHALVSFSIGYFLYDALDMVIYHRKRSTYELLVHHFMVITCLGIAVSTRQYVAYGGLSLMVEVNSVFLHTRQLFIITGEPKSSLRYRTNSLLNVATFLFFRILLLGWMTRWLTVNRDRIPLSIFTVGSVGLAVIVVMNIILFCRILSVDFSEMFRRQEGKEGMVVNGSSKSVMRSTAYVDALFQEEPTKLSVD